MMFYIALPNPTWRICVDFASAARHHVILEMTINGIPRMRKIPFHLEVCICHNWIRTKRELPAREKAKLTTEVGGAFTTFYRDNYVNMLEVLSGEIINASNFLVVDVVIDQ